MTRATTAPTAGRQPPTAVILFGLGDDRRPRAAHFPAKQANLAVKAASAMGFNVLKVAGADQAKIAAKLPGGRIYANGRGLVPFVRKDLYAKVTEAAQNGANGSHGSTPASAQAAAAAGPAGGQSPNQGSATGQPPAAPASPPARSRRPKSFR